MINLTMSHPVPTFGDSFTITCYVCGMPSSKEWAQKARSRPCTPMKPYFPFLLQITPLSGAILREDGSTYLCAFCHASLDAQWNLYESQQVVPPPNRKYNIQKFICAVCGVETYRKRIRALPFQEFPFLEKQRQQGSITLGNNPLAVVCLDCSETLWAQSAEYDRWGLPVQKRHFNWMARPPPPEDSVEATVARLPSGETQLPRCPPIEPSLVPKVHDNLAAKIIETSISSKARSKGKGDSPKLDSTSPIPQSSRKTSLTSTTPPSLDIMSGFHNQQPPVVTVAPMSSHTTVISMRKDSMSMPPGLMASHPGMYAQPGTAVYPPAAAYAPYVWGSPTAASREANQRSIEAYPYGAPETLHGAWPWMAQPSPDLLRYQSYVTSLQNRTISESRVSRSPTHTAVSSPPIQHFSGNSPTRHQTGHTSSALRDKGANEGQRLADTIAANSKTVAGDESIYGRNKGSPDPKPGKKSPKYDSRGNTSPNNRHMHASHAKKTSRDESNSMRSSSQQTENQIQGVDGVEDADKIAKRDFHIPKKRNWQVFMKESQSSTMEDDNSKKVEEISHPKKRKSSFSISKTAEASTSTSDSSGASNSGNQSPQRKKNSMQRATESRRQTDSAIDLSVGIPTTKSATQGSSKCTGASFRIEYLCQSESTKDDQVADDPSRRSSVIRCAPKVPPVTSESNSQDDNEEEPTETKNEPTSADAKPERKRKKPILEPIQEEIKVVQNKSDCLDAEKAKDNAPDKETGKRENQEQPSKMNVETKNEDLPNIEQFLKETVTELVNREKEQETKKLESSTKQKQFLEGLGLITPLEKTELEIKSLVSRHERKTLPPLQLRADIKVGRTIDKELKDLLLKVSLEDPTIFQDKPEVDKCDFMAELGMKTAEQSDKTKREIKWRVILMERMRREMRDADARGVKHEWEKSEILKKFADCDLESFFSSFSYAALMSSDEDLNKEVSEEHKEKEATPASSSNGVCINYPKYIPSYAVKAEEESTKSVAEVEEASGSSSLTFSEPILKIPVVSSNKRLSESSATATTDTDDDKLDDTQSSLPSSGTPTNSSANDPYPIKLDKLIQCSSSYWEQMKQNIDEILDVLDSSKEDVPLEEKASQVEKLRSHLKSQLSDIKEIEKRLRNTGKNLNVSRKRSQNHKTD